MPTTNWKTVAGMTFSMLAKLRIWPNWTVPPWMKEPDKLNVSSMLFMNSDNFPKSLIMKVAIPATIPVMNGAMKLDCSWIAAETSSSSSFRRFSTFFVFIRKEEIVFDAVERMMEDFSAAETIIDMTSFIRNDGYLLITPYCSSKIALFSVMPSSRMFFWMLRKNMNMGES